MPRTMIEYTYTCDRTEWARQRGIMKCYFLFESTGSKFGDLRFLLESAGREFRKLVAIQLFEAFIEYANRQPYFPTESASTEGA